jgi:hypothetical protein
MSSLAHKNEVANDKRKPFEFLITIEEAKEFGIPAKILLKMILANMSRRYKFLYPSIQSLATWTGLKPRTVENEMYRLVSDGWLVKAVDEIGRKGYKRPPQEGDTEIHQPSANLHQPSANLHSASAKLHQSSANLHSTSADLHQSDSAKYTNLVQKIHQVDETHYILKDKVNLTKELKEEEEGLSPQVASLPCVSDFSSPVVIPSEVQEQLINPAFVSEPTALEALVDQLVAKRLAEASRSLVTTSGHSDTRTAMVQSNGGTEMEATQGREVAITKRRLPATSRPPQLPIDQDLPEEEMKAVLLRFKEWLPSLNLKPEFHTEDFLGFTGQWICARQRKYLQRVEFFKDAPPTFNAIKLQLGSIQREGYDNALATVRDAATFEYKNLEYRPGKTGKSGTPMKSFKDQEREKGEEWLTQFINEGTFSFDLGGIFKEEA